MLNQEQDTDSELHALIGTTVDKYRIDRLLGRGGMGAVFQAQNLLIDKRVAIKFLNREAARDPEVFRRFQREARIAGSIESAHVVQIFESGSTESRLPFLVMELLTGEDLRSRLRREGRVAVASSLSIAGQVLRGLKRTHEAGIVHRDLKPENVFLCANDDEPAFVKLVDFGISKLAPAREADTLTRRGTVLGTAFYMSPEQAQSLTDIDGRSDLFSLGAILFEMLSGAPPHVAPTYEAVLIAICTHDAPDVRSRAPEVPEGVAALVARALERDRERRFQSVGEFANAIAELEGRLSGASVALSPRRESRQAVNARPRRTSYGTLLAGGLATLLGFALTAYLIVRSNASPNLSTEAASGSNPRTTVLAPSAPMGLPLTRASAPSSTQSVPLPSLSAEKPRRPAPPKPMAHVASELKLSTKEP